MTSPQLQSAYEDLIHKLGIKILEIQESLYDLPAPDSDHLTWGHVGDVSSMLEILNEIQLPKS